MEQLLQVSWLLIGIALFVGIVAYVYRPSAAKSYEDAGNIPFKRK